MTAPTLLPPITLAAPDDSCGGCTLPLADHHPSRGGTQTIAGIAVGSTYCAYLLDCRTQRCCAICLTPIDSGCQHLPLYGDGDDS